MRKSATPAGLAFYLNYRLERLSALMIKAANEAYIACCDLTARELRILRLVESEPGITFTVLLDKTLFERTQTSRILAMLIKRGLIKRTIGKSDARQFELSATVRGRKITGKAGTLGKNLEEILLSPLSSVERKNLSSCVDVLTTWVTTDRVAKAITAASFGCDRRPKRSKRNK